MAALCFSAFVYAQGEHNIYAHNGPTNITDASEMTCTPFGTCEPCPEAARNQPFCQPFGNRQLMHCSLPPSPSQDSHTSQPRQSTAVGEHLAWRACGRVIALESRDFGEFFACLVVFALVSTSLVVWRERRVSIGRQMALRARIWGR
ncbi:hypothetical protein CYLTODRAFT_424734 [Cylindrobasidium torrendii FP15055 ss-10]|uniref:Uncharacterized protein n=1 Tax=Cylindrobasidium torrendii FP15055 ss-10 TaxID=1314674 RepID=A0A0D7B3A7_9AGAR|nr:hypothetical protein CYLTODRAFT_424734 [Cylindrobasidium torrendii FP15055 ss-10]